MVRMIGPIMRSGGMLLLAAILLLTVNDISFAQKAEKETGYPGPVADWLSHARKDCAGVFRTGDAVRTMSLSGDGKPSYVIDPHRLVCEGAPNLYGGAGPVAIELFVTLPSAQVIHAASVVALGYHVMPAPDGGAPIVAFETHDPGQRAGSVDNYRWDGHDLVPLGRRSMALPPDDDISDEPSEK